MSSQKEISSTEKLLDLIRSGERPDKTSASRDLSYRGERGFRSTKRKLARGSVSVGVDIGEREIRLVKVERTSDNEWKLLDCRKVLFEKDLTFDVPECADFLKVEMTRFCGPARGINIWGSIPSPRVDVQHIRIPRVGKKKIENAVYWTAKKNIPFDDNETIFDFEVQGEVVESGVKKLAVVVYTAPKEEVEKMRTLFESAGFPLAGITIAPFAIQNIFKNNWIPSFEETAATLYIDRDWSRIDIFSDGVFVMTRCIKAGINSMIESLMEVYNESRKDIPVSNISSTAKTSMTFEEASELVFGLSQDSLPHALDIKEFGLEEREIFEMVNPALERLVRQIDRTFEYCNATFGKGAVSFIYVFSAMNVYQPVVDYIGDQLGIGMDVLDPFAPGNPYGGTITADISLSERVFFAQALGLSLSDPQETFNFIFTYKDKAQEESKKKLNVSILSFLVFIICFGFAYYLWLGHIVDEKEVRITQLEEKLLRGIQLNEEIILTAAMDIKKQYKDLKIYRERYLGIAVLGELSSLTPSNIRLFSVEADMSAGLNDEGKDDVRILMVNGIVTGNDNSFEASLARYVFALQESSLFDRAIISKKDKDNFKGNEGLRFTLKVEFN